MQTARALVQGEIPDPTQFSILPIFTIVRLPQAETTTDDKIKDINALAVQPHLGTSPDFAITAALGYRDFQAIIKARQVRGPFWRKRYIDPESRVRDFADQANTFLENMASSINAWLKIAKREDLYLRPQELASWIVQDDIK